MTAMPLETPEIRRFALSELAQEPVRRTPNGAIDLDFYLARGRALRSRALYDFLGRLAARLRGRRRTEPAPPPPPTKPRLTVVRPLPGPARSRTNA